MKEIKTEVLIHANSSKIWDVFTRFQDFPSWNPFIQSIQGEFSVGKNIVVKLTPPEAKAMTFKPKVLKIDPGKEIRWLGHFIIPGLMDGEHIFEWIDHHNNTTTFIQRENFSGILVPALAKLLDDNTKRGFIAMNSRLKELCES